MVLRFPLEGHAMQDDKDIDADTLASAAEERKEQAAADAYDRIKRGQHWLDWMDVAEGLATGRTKALRRAGTNNVQSPVYKRAFKEWMKDRAWARDLDQPTRAHLFWCIDNRNDIERWRETLASNERARLNHPTALKRKFEAAHRDAKAPSPEGAKETRSQKLEREIERLTDEREAWRKKAQTDGSLFDLMKDSAADIASAIAASVTFHKLTAIQKAIAEQIRRLKAEEKHAG
jgi:hypothetical protein